MNHRRSMLMASVSPLALATFAAFAAADIPLTNAPQGDTMYRPKEAPATTIGDTGKVALVHKQGAEGVIQIDAMTGRVLDPEDSRPEWADGLVVAQLAERNAYYMKRTGTEAPQSDAYAFEDLGWLALDRSEDRDGRETVLDADAEFRMDAVATILGLDREVRDTDAGAHGKVAAEMEIAADHTRTDEELAELERQQATASFEEHQRKSA